MTRTLRAARLAGLLALAGSLALGGCGSLEGDDVPPAGPDEPVSDTTSPTPAPSPTATPPPASATPPAPSAADLPAELTITLDESGNGQTKTWTLTCAPAGGDHPDPEGACAALAATGVDGFDPTPRDVACTEIYGGPQTATVEGTVDGSTVRATFSRTNGCEISRWDALGPLLGSVGGLM